MKKVYGEVKRASSKAAVLLITLPLLLLLHACNSASEVELRHRKRAVEYVALIANYTPEDVVSRFEQANEVLAPGVKESFGEAILVAERQAVLATKRRQEFAVLEEEISSRSEGPLETSVVVPGTRVRSVGKELSLPLELTYYLTLKETQGEDGRLRDLITDIQAVVEPGQEQSLNEEALLEQWNAASAAAKEERDSFKEAVSAVQQDLDRHQEKVEQDFERLVNSMDKLGSRVKQLSQGVKQLRQRSFDGQAGPAEAEQHLSSDNQGEALSKASVAAQESEDSSDGNNYHQDN